MAKRLVENPVEQSVEIQLNWPPGLCIFALSPSVALRHAKAKGNPIFGGDEEKNGNSIVSLFFVTPTAQTEEQKGPKTLLLSAFFDLTVQLLVLL